MKESSITDKSAVEFIPISPNDFKHNHVLAREVDMWYLKAINN
jgi:hypothetical protein